MAFAGRPPVVKDADEFVKRIEDYFKRQDVENRPYTIVGLALACGFVNKETFSEYGKRPEFSAAATWAKTIVEQQRVENLTNVDTKNVRGQEFDLRNNFGWKDKQEVDVAYPNGIDVSIRFVNPDEDS